MDMTLKLFGSQANTARKAFGQYWSKLDKLAKSEEANGAPSEGTRKIMAELEELILAVTPPSDQPDMFERPPESYETPSTDFDTDDNES